MYYNQNYNAYPHSYHNGIYGSSFNSPMQPQIRSGIVKVTNERLYNSVMRKIDEIE